MFSMRVAGTDMIETILEEAQRLTSGDRHQDYGTYTEEAKKVAAGWSVIFGCEIPARKVGLAMAWLKIVRECKKPKRDNRTDGAAYFHLTDQVVTDEETKRCDRCEIGTSLLPDGGCTNCVYQTDTDDFPPHGERVQVADPEDEADTVLSDEPVFQQTADIPICGPCTYCGDADHWRPDCKKLREDMVNRRGEFATCPFCQSPSHPNGTPCPKRLEEQLQMKHEHVRRESQK